MPSPGQPAVAAIAQSVYDRLADGAEDIMPIMDEIGRREPVPPRRRPAGYRDDQESDPLRASVWPPR